MTKTDATLDLVLKVLEDKKALEVKVLDIGAKTSIADFFVVCHATSVAHSKALADGVMMACKRAGVAVIGSDTERDSEWKILDYGTVIVHLFLEKSRKYYDLEAIWTSSDPASQLLRRGALDRVGDRRGLDVRAVFAKAAKTRGPAKRP